MKKDIKLNDDKTQVTVCLSLTKRHMARDPRMTITTRMVKTMLENDDFKLDKCLSYDTINNDNENSKHDGRWVFSLVSEIKSAAEAVLSPPRTKSTGNATTPRKKRPRKKKES